MVINRSIGKMKYLLETFLIYLLGSLRLQTEKNEVVPELFVRSYLRIELDQGWSRQRRSFECFWLVFQLAFQVLEENFAQPSIVRRQSRKRFLRFVVTESSRQCLTRLVSLVVRWESRYACTHSCIWWHFGCLSGEAQTFSRRYMYQTSGPSLFRSAIVVIEKNHLVMRLVSFVSLRQPHPLISRAVCPVIGVFLVSPLSPGPYPRVWIFSNVICMREALPNPEITSFVYLLMTLKSYSFPKKPKSFF